MTKKNNETMLAHQLISGDVIELPQTFNEFVVQEIKPHSVASLDSVSVIKVTAKKGPLKGMSGEFMIGPNAKVEVVKKARRPNVLSWFWVWLGIKPKLTDRKLLLPKG